MKTDNLVILDYISVSLTNKSNMEKYNCLACGKPLMGRIDKKYCDNQCRSTHHNRSKNKSEKMINAVNRQIRKNRAILRKLCPEGKATVRKEVLDAMGFSYQYFTSIYRTGRITYYFCYEFGFSPVHEKSHETGKTIQKVLLIHHQPYMKGQFNPWNYINA